VLVAAGRNVDPGAEVIVRTPRQFLHVVVAERAEKANGLRDGLPADAVARNGLMLNLWLLVFDLHTSDG
jgi:hypothetical protein